MGSCGRQAGAGAVGAQESFAASERAQVCFHCMVEGIRNHADPLTYGKVE